LWALALTAAADGQYSVAGVVIDLTLPCVRARLKLRQASSTRGEESEDDLRIYRHHPRGGIRRVGERANAQRQGPVLATALTITTTAANTCKGQGYRVSVSVVGRAGEAPVQLHGDDASPHTLDFSRRKAFTARGFRVASSEIANRFKRFVSEAR
jgi:hypothetical protein